MPNPNHASWGDAMQACAGAWTAAATRSPKPSARSRWCALAVLALAWWRFEWRPSRIRVGFTVFYVLLALGPFVHVAGVDTP